MEREKNCAIVAARAAGAIIRHFYTTDYQVDYKGADSPVTVADRNANNTLHEMLQGTFPDYGWLSEETADSPTRLSRSRVWVIDPLDGTKEFIEKIPEFAVSVALVENGEPIVGVAYNPINDDLCWAVRGQGAWRQHGGDAQAQQLRVSSTAQLAAATVLCSRSETKRGEWTAFQSLFATRPMGSIAYKLAIIAAGDADATFTLVPKNEWDICAGVLLVTEAGGAVSHLNGRPVIFNQPKTLLQGLVAGNSQLHPQLLELIARQHDKAARTAPQRGK